MGDNGRFEHTRLDNPGSQIRLLMLQSPRTTEDCVSVNLSLRVFDFTDESETPPYTALSYTWGPPSPLHTVTLNGREFSIRDNLWQFLKTLNEWPLDDSSHLRERWFWIDQLTIDQNDNEEKRHQVGIMDKIYNRAEKVLVWLGLPGKDSKHAEMYIKARNPSLGSRTTETKLNAEKLLKRPYWTRLWIMQEVSLARSLLFMCGNWTFKWNDLTRLTGLDTTNEWVVSFYRAITVAMTKRPLHEVILNFHSPSGDIGSGFLQCEKRVDKIYGLMGVVIPCERLGVDYTAPLENVVMEIVRVVVKSVANDVSMMNRDSAEAARSLKTVEDAILASCKALKVDWPQGLDIHEEWERHLRAKMTLTDLVKLRVRNFYSWFR
ncbi:uncharacterized protein CTRU02_215353 [Colletotrichum truncatum]|uniref:Uncharacterized protein n=1 Tax=Colletotrichum truncatum TaxID=5467 RepID=A0ACC3YD19_COLTU|nr:uncharacterized protein CTRU02_13308 [Colletotrichum truncatum]KAF6783545.1 hypothetical protein CTRU02_13308 [Colletotrichum truncatum]